MSSSPQPVQDPEPTPATPTTLAVDAALPATNPELDRAREEGQKLSGEIAELNGQLASKNSKSTELNAALAKSITTKEAAEKALAEAQRKRDQAKMKCERLTMESQAKAELQELRAKTAEAELRAKEAARDSVKNEDKVAYLMKQIEDAQAELEKAKERSTQEREAAEAAWVAKEAEVSAEIEKREQMIESGAGAKTKKSGSRKKKTSEVVERAIELHRKKRESVLYGEGGLKESLDSRKKELQDLKKDLSQTNNKIKFYLDLDAEYESVKKDTEEGPKNRDDRKKEVVESLAKVKQDLEGSAKKEEEDAATTEKEKEEASAQLDALKVQVDAAKEREGNALDAMKAEAAAVVASAKEQKEKANALVASLQEPIAAPSAEVIALHLERQKKLDERKKEQNTRKKDLESQIGVLKKEIKKAAKKSEAGKKRKRASAALN